jgi:hypothetical protein
MKSTKLNYFSRKKASDSVEYSQKRDGYLYLYFPFLSIKKDIGAPTFPYQKAQK